MTLTAGTDSEALSWGPVPAHVTFDLRQRLLRPHEPVQAMALSGDEDVSSGFFAVWRPGHPAAPLGVVSVRRQARVGHPEDAWRLRGLAVVPSWQRAGLGSVLLRCVTEHVVRYGGRSVWCAVRTSAEDFYRKRGFVVRGEPFELPAIGRHVHMVCSLARPPVSP